MAGQDAFQSIFGGIAHPQPYDCGWRSKPDNKVGEILIFGDEDHLLFAGSIEDLTVFCLMEPKISDGHAILPKFCLNPSSNFRRQTVSFTSSSKGVSNLYALPLPADTWIDPLSTRTGAHPSPDLPLPRTHRTGRANLSPPGRICTKMTGLSMHKVIFYANLRDSIEVYLIDN